MSDSAFTRFWYASCVLAGCGLCSLGIDVKDSLVFWLGITFFFLAAFPLLSEIV